MTSYVVSVGVFRLQHNSSSVTSLSNKQSVMFTVVQVMENLLLGALEES